MPLPVSCPPPPKRPSARVKPANPAWPCTWRHPFPQIHEPAHRTSRTRGAGVEGGWRAKAAGRCTEVCGQSRAYWYLWPGRFQLAISTELPLVTACALPWLERIVPVWRPPEPEKAAELICAGIRTWRPGQGLSGQPGAGRVHQRRKRFRSGRLRTRDPDARPRAATPGSVCPGFYDGRPPPRTPMPHLPFSPPPPPPPKQKTTNKLNYY